MQIAFRHCTVGRGGINEIVNFHFPQRRKIAQTGIVWVSPHARKVYPPRTRAQAYLAGLAWGWIPCGLVYGVLPLAFVAGGAGQGVLVMVAFGVGTLPALTVVDVAASRLSASGSLVVGHARVLVEAKSQGYRGMKRPASAES